MSKTKLAKPIFGYAIKTHGVLSASDVYDFTADARADAIRYANRPAGQSVVKVRISEVSTVRRATLSASSGRGK